VKIPEVKQIVGDLPYMPLTQAEKITRLITDYRLENILELGFMHGVSTCYMAAALGEQGRGSIVTIDLEWASFATPNVETLLQRIGERDRVTVFYEPTSYNWRLMKFLEEDPTPRFDLCYLDGSHTWHSDALAFFLVDRLLKPGGWFVFDDLNWTVTGSPLTRGLEAFRRLPLEEQTTPQVRKIYDLLVKPHPDYHNFREEEGWAFAQKRTPAAATPAGPREVVTEHIVRVERVEVGVGAFLTRAVNKLRGH
jgi:predicted O-methyltransferase YrrM